MARRYDSRTTIFSPEGRLFQVEYAMESISHAGTALGILATDGVILAAEKRVTSKLLEQQQFTTEKLYLIDDQLCVAVAGLTADANTLIQYARLAAQRHLMTYNEQMPCEQLAQKIGDLKQGYTQYGGLRPFGVAFLYAGWDDSLGFQLYHSDPSGNYYGWKAHCIGSNKSTAQSILKQDYKEDITLADAKKLAVKVLSKTMETTKMDAEKLEIATLTMVDDGNGGQRVKFKLFTHKEVEAFLKENPVPTGTDAA